MDEAGWGQGPQNAGKVNLLQLNTFAVGRSYAYAAAIARNKLW